MLEEILDHIYMHCKEGTYLEIGIWDTEPAPYTMYALLKSKEGQVLVGESSYGSYTVEEALQCLLKEL